MIAWLPGLRRLAIENGAPWNAWGEALAQSPASTVTAVSATSSPTKDGKDGAPVALARTLARHITTKIAIDHVTGKVDRRSGHQVLVDVTGTRVIFLDNNLAFLPVMKLQPMHEGKRLEVLHRVERFSRKLVVRLRALDRKTLAAWMGEDHEGKPLLSDVQLDATLVHRDELLGHVDALIARWSEERVLSFE
jgi:hypothetical protein